LTFFEEQEEEEADELLVEFLVLDASVMGPLLARTLPGNLTFDRTGISRR
jgi:hypothetical protein